MFSRIIVTGFLPILLLFTSAVKVSYSEPASSPPTKITSDTMMVRNQDSQAIFHKNVVLTKGSLTVQSDKMVVFYKDKGSQGSPPAPSTSSPKGEGSNKVNIEKIVATGRVVIKKEKGRATCQKAIYYMDGQKIELMGSPKAWQEGNQVTGEKIIMFLDDDRTIVEGGSQVIIQ